MAECLWKRLPIKFSRHRQAWYQCVCGTVRQVVILDVTKGKSKGCGCVRVAVALPLAKAASTKHGAHLTREFSAWVELRRRCRATSRHDSKNYSERGISVDPRWDTFIAFREDMGDRPEGHSLDRIDNEKGYCKENCRWATRKEQERNKRSNRLITVFCEVFTVSAACEFYQINSNAVYQRLNRGWPPEKALLSPGFHKPLASC